MNNVLLFKGILIFNTLLIVYITINYIKYYRIDEGKKQECIDLLNPLIKKSIKDIYHETRNNFVLRSIKEVYEYEKILENYAFKEILNIRFSSTNQIQISKYLEIDEIELMIKYEISKLNIMIDKYAIEVKTENNSKPNTINITEYL